MFVMPLRRFALAVVIIVALAVAAISYLAVDFGLTWYVAVIGDCAVVCAALILTALIARATLACPRYFAPLRREARSRRPARPDYNPAARRPDAARRAA